MSRQLKVCGLGVIALLVASAVAVTSSGAETGGHFVSSSAGTTSIVGSEGGTHALHSVSEGGEAGQRIGCDNDSYTGALSGGTATQITIAPNWSRCYTTGEPKTTFDIHEKECHFLFTVGKNPEGHNTAHITCPQGVLGIQITHQSCGIVIPPQTVNGISYRNEGSPHEVTLTSTVKGITAHYHSGSCIFLGTVHKFEMNGSMTLKGFSGSQQISITATG
jgi:hypothetical protein